MSLLGRLVLSVIAAAAAAAGQPLVGFSRGGCLASIAVGFIGAYLGMWIAQRFHLPTFLIINVDGQPFPLVWPLAAARSWPAC